MNQRLKREWDAENDALSVVELEFGWEFSDDVKLYNSHRACITSPASPLVSGGRRVRPL